MTSSRWDERAYQRVESLWPQSVSNHHPVAPTALWRKLEYEELLQLCIILLLSVHIYPKIMSLTLCLMTHWDACGNSKVISFLVVMGVNCSLWASNLHGSSRCNYKQIYRLSITSCLKGWQCSKGGEKLWTTIKLWVYSHLKKWTSILTQIKFSSWISLNSL